MTDSPHHSTPEPAGSTQPAGSGAASGNTPDPATWAALLARWVEFARAALAMPADREGKRWRAAVAPIITLQAVVHALGEIDLLPPGEQTLALDRAGLLIRQAAGELSRLWHAEPLPDRLLDLIEDAGRALDGAESRGRHWIVREERFVMGPLDGVLAALEARGFAGDLLAAPPGSILFAGEPALCARPDAMLDVPGLVRAEHTAPALQVYRQVDGESGRVVRDLVAPLHAALPPGRPLLVTVIEQGRRTDALRGHDADAWRALQERLLPEGVVEVAQLAARGA